MPNVDLTNVSALLGPSAEGLPLADDETPLQRENFNNCWTTLEYVVHGALDTNNFNATPISHDATRRGSLVDGQSVGGTANLDYLNYTYSHVNQNDWDPRFDEHIAINNLKSHAIPGGSTVLQLAYPALVDIRFNVFWVNDGFSADNIRRQSLICLKVNGAYFRHQIRGCGACGDYIAGGGQHGNVYEEVRLDGYKGNRTFTGHLLISLPAGEHTIELAHISDRSIALSRVWVRGLRTLTFLYKDQP